jgi:uncharacterized alkaline shock family protein YloU
MENKLGNVKIDKNAIAQIAYQSILETYGLTGFGHKSKTGYIAELLKGDSAVTKGVRVDFEEDRLAIELYVIIQYGVNITTVSENIIDKVKFNVETMTGLEVNEIIVNVQGVATK